VKQSLCKLETKEVKVAKMGSNLTIMETADTLGVESPVFKTYWLPLIDLFAFNLFFFNCLTYFFMILLDFFYCILEVVFGFLGNLSVACPFDFVL